MHFICREPCGVAGLRMAELWPLLLGGKHAQSRVMQLMCLSCNSFHDDDDDDVHGPQTSVPPKPKTAQAYQCQVAAGAPGERPKIRCLLLDESFDSGLVCASHLFKYCWHMDVYATLGFHNINDTRNGLLLLKWVNVGHYSFTSLLCVLRHQGTAGAQPREVSVCATRSPCVIVVCRPLEEAFDNGFLVFTYDDAEEKFTAHWLGDDKAKIAHFNTYPWKTNEKLSKSAQNVLRE